MTPMEIKKIEDPKFNNPNAFDSKKAIIIIVIFMVIVASLWFAVVKMRSSGPKDTGNTNSDLASSTEKTAGKKVQAIPQDSFYKGYVKITNFSSKETYPEKEYITIAITQPNLSEVDVTNWKLRNSKGETASLGQGTNLFFTGKVNPAAPIKLKGGDILTVSTGRSPIGVSFRTNSCTLYLEQFQDFIPPINTSCPSSRDKGFTSLDSACQKYINALPRCTTNETTIPSELSASCMTFIYSHINYNGCVLAHKNDANFYSKEWRVFLGRASDLWSQTKDTITLLDSEGKIIGTVAY